MATLIEDDLAGALRTFASIFQREVDGPLLRELRAACSSLAGVLRGDPLADLDLADEEAALETLAVEYCRLFIGPRGHLPPVESVVRGERRFWGRHTEEVVAFYRGEGLAPDPAARVLPDHLSVELDCLAVLEERGRHDRAARFAREHPLRWLPALAEHVERRAALPFYPTWCGGLTCWLEELYPREER